MLHEWTGERLETFILSETTVEHLHRYALAMDYVKGKTVLDLACGEGYGAAFFADTAAHVTGIDKDEETVKKAGNKYRKTNLIFKQGDVRHLPLSTASVDVVVSFETLEHIAEHDEMLKEIKRVLRPDGTLVISTPDKKFHEGSSDVNNKFHVKELYEEEFKTLLRRYFHHTAFLRQSSFFTSAILSEGTEKKPNIFYQGDFTAVKKSPPPDPVFCICIASDLAVEVPDHNSFFKGGQIFYEAVKEYETAVFNSRPYKIGNFLLSPFRWVRNLLKR